MTTHEPPERYLARVEAAAHMVENLPRCQHCAATPVALEVMDGGELPKVIELRHERGCPVLVEFEDAPAVEC
jgi:hypothetical protein